MFVLALAVLIFRKRKCSYCFVRIKHVGSASTANLEMNNSSEKLIFNSMKSEVCKNEPGNDLGFVLRI